jgi:hypothetical protein
MTVPFSARHVGVEVTGVLPFFPGPLPSMTAEMTVRFPIGYDFLMKKGHGRVKTLVIGPEAKKPLQEAASVMAIAGQGLEGDRYCFGRGSFNAPQFDRGVREVTLIAAEAIDECNARLGTALKPADFRRNIVTEGVDLPALKGKRLRVGETVLRFARSAPPCRYLSRLLGEEMIRGLKGIGGIRAVIEQGGEIKTGDAVRVLP